MLRHSCEKLIYVNDAWSLFGVDYYRLQQSGLEVMDHLARFGQMLNPNGQITESRERKWGSE